MTGTITCLWLLLALTAAKNIGYIPATLPNISSPSLPTQQWNTQDEIGQASFGYSYSGQAATNVRDADGHMAGSWAYVNPEGKLVNVSYTADQRGFRVSSNVLPVTSLADSTVRSVKASLNLTDGNSASIVSDDSLRIGNVSTRLKRQTNEEANFGESSTYFEVNPEELFTMKEAHNSDFPFMVALFKFDKAVKRYTFACSGSLISENSVLTAAHCVTIGNRTLDVENFFFKIGASFLNKTHANAGDTKRVSSIDVHEQYDPVSRHNDIAIMELESSVSLSGTTRIASTICLPKEFHKGAQSGNAIFSGWIFTKSGEYEPIRYTTAKMIDNKECAKTYTGEKEIADHMICAIGLQDFCENFDGGPLLIPGGSKECPWVQMGIISFGRGCSEKGKPAVYTRLTSFWPWINYKMDPVYDYLDLF